MILIAEKEGGLEFLKGGLKVKIMVSLVRN